MFKWGMFLFVLIALPAAVFSQQEQVPFVVTIASEQRPPPPQCSEEDIHQINQIFENSIVKWASVFFNDGTLMLDSAEMIDLEISRRDNNGLGMDNRSKGTNAKNESQTSDRASARELSPGFFIKRAYLYSATNTYTCRLCTADNNDKRRTLRHRNLFVHHHFENYMSYQVSEDLRYYAREAYQAKNRTLHCLGSGEEIDVEFCIKLDSSQTSELTPQATPQLSSQPTPQLSSQPTPQLSSQPTPQFSSQPTPQHAPTKSPSKSPTKSSSKSPTKSPSKSPTKSPSKSPTKSPSKSPTKLPSKSPTKSLTLSPKTGPTKSPTKSFKTGPTKSPTKSPTIQGKPCPLPVAVANFSLITHGDASITAKRTDKGVIVGGELKRSLSAHITNIANITKGPSYIDDLDSKFNFGGAVINIRTLADSIMPTNFSWSNLETIARTARGGVFVNGTETFRVVVFTKGGDFTVDSGLSGDPNDRGRTLMVFNTNESVKLTRTPDNKAFGPSVLAPFSSVELEASANSVDGFIVAKDFKTSGVIQASLVLKGNGYRGPLFCLK